MPIHTSRVRRTILVIGVTVVMVSSVSLCVAAEADQSPRPVPADSLAQSETTAKTVQTAGVPQSAPRSPRIMASLTDGRLTVTAANASLSQVLQAIGEQADIEVHINGELDPQPTSWSCDDVPLADGIRTFVGEYNMMFIGARPTKDGPLQRAQLWVYGELTGAVSPTIPKDVPLSAAIVRTAKEANLPQDLPLKLQAKIIEILAQPNPASRLQAVHTVTQQYGVEALPVLTHVLGRDEDASVRKGVVNALEQIGGLPAIRALETGFGDTDVSVRQDIVSSLGRMDAQQALPSLGRIIFADTAPEVRLTAIQAIQQQDTAAARALLEVAAEDADETISEVALEALLQWDESP